ncbi:LapA family protein [Blastococcus sp. CCUG 61487]|uniref:LapA family protein n=1 Tax=Blastococcus sp. CCUG 61487 TaxID=1840703 RepID=UPI0010C10CFF|nr:LapA family protein [Blastococcus sp. CCUG 61487]TKJ31687.1 hypothetical protein A6V29_18125 [Blastococcus sp. CCUG 61487]
MSTPDPRAPGGAADPLDVGLGGPATTGASPGPATTPPSSPAAPERQRHTGRTIGRTLAVGLLLFVTVVLVLFVVFNGQTVQISLVFTDVDAPLVTALLIAAVLGALLGWLSSLLLRTRRRRRS